MIAGSTSAHSVFKRLVSPSTLCCIRLQVSDQSRVQRLPKSDLVLRPDRVALQRIRLSNYHRVGHGTSKGSFPDLVHRRKTREYTRPQTLGLLVEFHQTSK